MKPAILAGHDELVTLAEMVSRNRQDIPAKGVPVSLLADVMRQVGCHRLIVVGYDPGREETWFRQGILGDGWPERPVRTLLDDLLGLVPWAPQWGRPACRHPRRDEPREGTAPPAYYPAWQWHEPAAYREVYRPLGLEHQISLSLASAPGAGAQPQRELRMFLFRCPGPDFTERDRAVLRLLGPHLRQAFQDAELRRRARPQRTARPGDPPGAPRRAVGPAPAGRHRAHQHPDRPAAGHLRGHRPQAPGEHLRPPRRVQPHRRRHPRLSRADGDLVLAA